MSESSNSSGAERKKADWSSFVPQITIGLIVTVVFGIIATVAATAINSAITSSIAAAVATCDNPQQLTLETNLTATADGLFEYRNGSTLYAYPAKYLVDGTRTTAWLAPTSANHADGQGDEIRVTLPQHEDVQLLCVINGYSKDSTHALANGSVRVLRVTTAKGARDAALPALTQANAFDYQPIAFAPGETSFINLQVEVPELPSQTGSLGPTSAAMSEIEVWVKK